MPNKPPQKSSRNEIFPHFSSHNQFFTLTLQPNKNKTMKNIFKIKKEERILALVSMLVFASLNAVLIHSYPANFFKAGKLGFWSIFYKHFTVSGFDAYSYIFLSNEKIYFELSRHPLFGALLYPGACLNDWLMGWTHHNCATFIMAVMLVISATFSAVFFFRICRELIQLCRLDAYILTAFFSPLPPSCSPQWYPIISAFPCSVCWSASIWWEPVWRWANSSRHGRLVCCSLPRQEYR